MNLFDYHMQVVIGGSNEVQIVPKAALEKALANSSYRTPDVEAVIAKDAACAYNYAKKVIKGPWPQGEPVIKTRPRIAAIYAIDCLREPWPEAEGIIASTWTSSYLYRRAFFPEELDRKDVYA